MEHIVQFGISIDDEAIKRSIEDRAKKELVSELNDKIKGIIFERDHWGRATNGTPSSWVKAELDLFLEKNKEAIIDGAIKCLADKLARTKAVKEAVGNVLYALEGEK